MSGLERFNYSNDLEAMIVHLHRGKESWPHYHLYIAAHLGGVNGRVSTFVQFLCPEIAFRCGPLADKLVLDFGCGTGASSVALALSGARVIAADICQESLEIARKRVQEHGLEDRVKFAAIDDLPMLQENGSFDLVLMNGVIEHIPTSDLGLRVKVLATAANCLRRGGYLYISETPNRLWPKDTHSTGLWFLPWTPAGSKIGYNYAISRGRHTECATLSQGPRGLEEVGAWGATYWELNAALQGLGFRCKNAGSEQGQRVNFTYKGSAKRRIFEHVIYWLVTLPFGIPIIAFCPFLDHLVFVRE